MDTFSETMGEQDSYREKFALWVGNATETKVTGRYRENVYTSFNVNSNCINNVNIMSISESFVSHNSSVINWALTMSGQVIV